MLSFALWGAEICSLSNQLSALNALIELSKLMKTPCQYQDRRLLLSWLEF